MAENAVGWQRIEGLLVFAAPLLLYLIGDRSLGLWPALLIFFAPDLSFAAYALGPKLGAAAYNTVHIYGFGAVVLFAGSMFGLPILSAMGLLWLAHSGFDRMLGYGLKLPSGFSRTHLGNIGKSRP